MKTTFKIPAEAGAALDYLQKAMTDYKLKKTEINRAGSSTEPD